MSPVCEIMPFANRKKEEAGMYRRDSRLGSCLHVWPTVVNILSIDAAISRCDGADLSDEGARINAWARSLAHHDYFGR